MNAEAHIEPFLRRPWTDTWRGYVLCGTLLVAPLVYTSEFTSFLDAKLAALGVGAVLLALLGVARRGYTFQGVREFTPLWLIIVFSLIAHLLLGTARVPTYTIEESVRLTLFLLIPALTFDLFLDKTWRFRIRWSLIVSGLVLALLGYLQYFHAAPAMFPVYPEYDQRMYSVFGNQDLLAGYLAFVLPLLFAETCRPGKTAAWSVTGLLWTTPVLLLSGSRSAWLACVLGAAVVLPLARTQWKRTTAIAASIALVALATAMLAPAATIQRVSTTFSDEDVGFQARVWFWDAGLRMVRDMPVAGQGLGHFKYWSPYYQGKALHSEVDRQHYHNELHTLHAHSDLIELTAETGIIGLLFALLMVVKLSRFRGPEWGGLAAILVFALVNPTVQSGPHVVAGLVLAGNLIARARSREKNIYAEERERFGNTLVLSGSAICAVVFVAGAILLPSYWLAQARDAYDRGGYGYPYYKRLAEFGWPEYRALEELGIIYLGSDDLDEADALFRMAREGIDTGQLYFLEGTLAERERDVQAAAEAFEACLWRWPGYVPAWEHYINLLPRRMWPEYVERARRWLTDEEMERLGRTLDEIAGFTQPEEAAKRN